MDDEEGGMSFDFEGGLDLGPSVPTSAPVVQAPAVNANGTLTAAAGVNIPFAPSVPSGQAAEGIGGGAGGRRSFRQTVCRHWLRSLCMKGDSCGFLHQYDKSRMPVCRFFRLYGECREQDCVYKHTNEDIKECNMYKLGFCPNGPDCRYRHAKLPGPPPPVEEVLQKIQQLASGTHGNNKFFQNRSAVPNQQSDKSQFPQVQHGVNQLIKPVVADSINVQQQSQQPQQHSNESQIQNTLNNPPIQASRVATPLPQGTSRYFVVKSCNRENLELSVQQGVWATQRSNEAKLNEAFDSVDNVILIFSVNKTRHFQGCAKMTSKIGGFIGGGNWKHAHGTAHYGRNFAIKWLKLSELSFDKTRHLRNSYNENLPVKISRDCQELEPSIGEQLASLLYNEPDSDLTAVLVAAEAKREPENGRGTSADNGAENPDIVPFEDNEEEEEEEEESEEEEDNSLNIYGVQGRGRARGIGMWPHIPIARGARPFTGFPPGMMGDGFAYGSDGYPMAADPFGMASRGFGHFGPRFPGDFPGPTAPGMMFPARPTGGYGMVMRPPPPGHGGVGMVPFYQQPPPLPQSSNRAKKDQIAAPVDRNYQQIAGSDDGAGNQGAKMSTRNRYEDHYSGGNNYKNEESESEDEAPRRSRHGEGKKKRRGLEETDSTAVSAEG